MFRGKYGRPAADIDRYLPELRAYAKARREPNKTGPAPFPLPGRAEATLKEPDQDSLPLPTGEIQKDPSLLDSPAMRRYYRSWEKQEAVTKTFSSEVMRMVDERYAKASAFYLPAGIDKRTFHKIRSDYLYRPSRGTAMKCCLGLKLGRAEADELMRLAGYSFSPSDPSDLAVMFCIENGIWDLASVNYLMGSFDLKDLDGYSQE